MSCSTWQLYVILDRAAAGGRDLREVAAAAVRGGADALQLRDKTSSDDAVAVEARRLLPVARAGGVPLILNDRVAVAMAVGADGVHVGQDDWPMARVRRTIGPTMLVGQSTHSVEQAAAAQAAGADYIGFGPLFATPTKPEYPPIGTGLIRQAAAQVSIPLVCIGGVDHDTIGEALAAGARCVAVVRAVCAAADPEAAARQLKSRIAQFRRAAQPSRL
ncbi:MAG: thiamine phosphate synthase [Candidatus Omnitrophica bacterium]|nr:thiamine phosphate synthase [Candidatus Omnitrophota bacterium]